MFARLEEVPIADILPFPARQYSVMEVTLAQNCEEVKLVVGSGRLLARSGWEKMVSSRWLPVPHWPMEQLLMVEASMEDELAAFAECFPPPNTVFCMSPFADILDAEFLNFWEAAKKALVQGATAQDLAKQLQLPLDYVCLYAQELRCLGVGQSVRA